MSRLTRREFLKAAGTVAAGTGLMLVPGTREAKADGTPTYSTLLPQVTLGNTGVQVSRLGLGGANWIQDAPASDDPYVEMALHHAIDLGITYFDTAHNYDNVNVATGIGDKRSQTRIGNVMATRRNEVFLATKFEATDFSSTQRTYDKIMPEVQECLTKLQTDHFDLLQVHMVYDSDDLTKWTQANGCFWTLQQLKDQGVTRFIGMTGHPLYTGSTPDGSAKVKTALQQFNFDCFLGHFNPWTHANSMFTDQLPAARAKGMGCIAMKPLGGGNPATNVGYGKGQLPYDDLIRYSLSQPRDQFVDVIVPGIGNAWHVDQLVNVVKGMVASDGTFQQLQRYQCDQIEARANQTYVWITDAKRRPDSVTLNIDDTGNLGVIVTAVFADCCYVESADRTGGIKVTNYATTTGKRLRINTGQMFTDANGERYIKATSTTQVSSGASVKPLALTNGMVGGGNWAMGTANNCGQRGVVGGAGLNTIGLLVKTTGKVVSSGTGYCYITDGTRTPTGYPYPGLRIDCTSGTAPTSGYKEITGIATLYYDGTDYYPCIRIRSNNDIQSL